MEKRCAFIGMGVMGRYMAANITKSYMPVSVWNRTYPSTGLEFAKENGCLVSDSLEETVDDKKFICLCLSNDNAVFELLLDKQKGLINYLSKGAIVIDFSTISSDTAVAIETALAKKSISYVDAPVSGGDVGAKNASLSVMVGGTKENFEQVLPILKTIGKNITYCGSTGSGQTVKMINQVLCAVHMVALSEAMLIAENQNIDKSLIVNVCSAGAAGSWALSNLGLEIERGNFRPGFAVKHMLKDINIALDTLKKNNLNLPGLQLASSQFEKTLQLETGEDLGTQAMYLTYKTRLSKKTQGEEEYYEST